MMFFSDSAPNAGESAGKWPVGWVRVITETAWLIGIKHQKAVLRSELLIGAKYSGVMGISNLLLLKKLINTYM